MRLTESAWVTIGLVGQFFFTMRFVVQWIATEKKRKSVVPETFWYFSIVGSLVLLAYSIYRKDPVFILGQSFGTTVYLRNLYFINKEKKDVSP
ncbi:MAG: lipid-A-disaccharide synthase N-terminal domain-containing protein [Desulfuromonadaceae bacterium]|nr:lipid-A-disaccharide synthase N-terminal domain-containing protein [Desulfuromonadaceae bacterium]MDD2854584.1 lipid-A-disaccharide synthase N-terminal domain-containing protein [Desulfuromonadaceae bacterium]